MKKHFYWYWHKALLVVLTWQTVVGYFFPVLIGKISKTLQSTWVTDYSIWAMRAAKDCNIKQQYRWQSTSVWALTATRDCNIQYSFAPHDHVHHTETDSSYSCHQLHADNQPSVWCRCTWCKQSPTWQEWRRLTYRELRAHVCVLPCDVQVISWLAASKGTCVHAPMDGCASACFPVRSSLRSPDWACSVHACPDLAKKAFKTSGCLWLYTVICLPDCRFIHDCFLRKHKARHPKLAQSHTCC